MKNVILIVCGLCIALMAIGCGNDTPTSPGSEPRVVNSADTFEFQVTSVKNYTAVWGYDWTTTGTVVNVDHSSAVTGGTATLRILDASDKLVYSRNLAQDGSFTSEAGTTGAWRIEIVLSKASGTLNFRVEKNQ